MVSICSRSQPHKINNATRQKKCNELNITIISKSDIRYSFLKAWDINVNPSNPTETYNELINRVGGGIT